MIAHDKPQSDDGPEPERMTARRLAAKLHRVAEQAGRLKLELRSYALYIGKDAGPGLDLLVDQLGVTSMRLVDLAAAVRVGKVSIDHDLVDGEHTPERPILDRIEGAAAGKEIDRRIHDDDRERIVERGDTDPEWEAPPAKAPAPKGKTRAGRKRESRSRPSSNGTLSPAEMHRPDVAGVLRDAAAALGKKGGT